MTRRGFEGWPLRELDIEQRDRFYGMDTDPRYTAELEQAAQDRRDEKADSAWFTGPDFPTAA